MNPTTTLHILATIALLVDALMRYRQALVLWYRHIRALDAIYRAGE